MMIKTIGILAGMGPRSTTPFLELVLDECQKQYGAKYDIDYPHIIIYSLPTPFFIDREINEDKLKQTIIEGAKRLDSFGVDIIAIPCNTAHQFYADIQSVCKAKMLHIIDETMKNIPAKNKVTVLATQSTMATGLYQKGIKDKQCEFVFIPSWQTKINNIIGMIKTKTNMKKILNHWNELIAELKSEGVSCMVLACTDLSVISAECTNIITIDSSVALAKAVVRDYLNNKNVNKTY